MKVVNQPVMKKDAMALVTGKPVFTDDKAPKDCLIVKLLRSPYANAMIKSINTQFAMKVPGIEAIYTWEDVPQERFTMAGQTYPGCPPLSGNTPCQASCSARPRRCARSSRRAAPR